MSEDSCDVAIIGRVGLQAAIHAVGDITNKPLQRSPR